jgi:hypothetical protein
MAYGSTLDTAAARAAISKGDDLALERYLREGGNNPVQNCTSATANLIPGTNIYNRAGGITGTLPNATGSQEVVTVVVGTTLTSSGIIRVARAADTMIGTCISSTLAGTGAFTDGVGGTDDTITMAAGSGTQGGLIGSTIKLTDIAPNLWLVDGKIIGTGTMVTSFSAGV